MKTYSKIFLQHCIFLYPMIVLDLLVKWTQLKP